VAETEPTRVTINTWMRGLIEKLLALTPHSMDFPQHHKASLHEWDNQAGSKTRRHEIEAATTWGSATSQKQKFLLEIDTSDLIV
jgi:hypothetical protein